MGMFANILNHPSNFRIITITKDGKKTSFNLILLVISSVLLITVIIFIILLYSKLQFLNTQKELANFPALYNKDKVMLMNDEYFNNIKGLIGNDFNVEYKSIIFPYFIDFLKT